MLQVFMSDERLRAALTEARTIAVIGAKDKPGQAVDEVGRYLIAAGYTVIPGPPGTEERLGAGNLRVAWRHQGTGGHRGCIPRSRILPGARTGSGGHAPKAWPLLDAARHQQRRSCHIAEQAGISVVEDKCIMVEHRRLLGASRA